jgi:triphosphoribosyl-dephospho-CoA synthase
VQAAPAGLGRADRYDVFAPATVSLREAMAEAADRDRIARQYASDYADIFDLGEPLLTADLAGSHDRRRATLAVYLAFLATFPDTHVARKHGAAVAGRVRWEAARLQQQVRRSSRLEDVLPAILAWDTALKRDGINPGTSADLTVATLFTHRLRSILPATRNSA